MNRRRLLALSVGSAGAFIAAPVFAMPTGQTTPLEDLPGQEVQGARDVTRRLRTQVFVNGQGPFSFIVDTAANRSAVSADLALRLGLPAMGEDDVHALSGPFRANFVGVRELRSGAVELHDTSLPILSRDVLSDADGLLGVEAMADRQLTLDFRNNRIVIARANRALSTHNWAQINGRLRFGNLVVANGTIGRRPVHVVIDTGAQTTIANTALQHSLQEDGYEVFDQRAATRMLNAGRPIVLERAVAIPRLRLGQMSFLHFAASVTDAYVFDLWELQHEPTLVIGMDVLRATDAMAIDYRRGTVHFMMDERARM